MKDNFDLTNLKKKKKINSRTKGNTFERKISKLLNEKFNTTDFQRSPGSGAFATTHTLPDYLKIYGDLITPKDFVFCIECKKGYNKITLGDLLKPNCEIYKFFEQATIAADACGKFPLLIIQQDNKEPLCFINKELVETNMVLPYGNIRLLAFSELLKVNNVLFFFVRL